MQFLAGGAKAWVLYEPASVQNNWCQNVCVTYLCKFMGSGKASLSNPSHTDSQSKPSTLQDVPTNWRLLQVTFVYEEQDKSNAYYFFLRNYN
jgi:hypothetical protein